MAGEDKSTDQLPDEMAEMRRRLAAMQDRETEHKRVAEALVQSEAKFRKLTENAVVGVYLIQGSWFRYINPKFARIFGYEVPELMIEGGPKTVVYDEDWPLVEQNLRKRFSGEIDAVNFQFRGKRKDGEIVYVEVYGSRTDYNGSPAVIGTLLDITDRVRTRQDLKKELTKFQGLYDLALAMTTERSLEENLLLVVEKSRELLGADKSFIALRDETAGDLCMHTLSGVVTDVFKTLRIPFGEGLGGKVAESGRRHFVEDYFREVGPLLHDVVRGEGLISGIAVPVQIGQQNLGVLYAFNKAKTSFSKPDLDTLSLLGNLAAVEIIRDRSKEKLRESEEQFRKLYEESKRREDLYRSLLNSSVDAIVIYDMEGRAKYVNPAFTRIFGWTMEEVEGRRIPFLPESEREATMAIIYGLIRDGTPTSGFETRRYTKDGRLLDVSISASRYHDHEGAVEGTLVIIRDITAFKSLELARRRAVHHLSHELKTPLAIMKVSLKKLADEGISAESRYASLERMRRNLRRLTDVQQIVEQIVIPRVCNPRPFPIIQTIQEILETCRQESAHRSVELRTRIEDIETDLIDPEILRDVLETLVKNAIENTPDEGEVVVCLARVDSGILLEVSDKGVGIAASDREYIFRAFHHTQDTEHYATKNPFDFDAGGKGLELMRLKILAEEGCFDISFAGERCRYIPTASDQCPGRISSCKHIENLEGCKQSGGATFSVLFPSHREDIPQA
jgi:PAS domain S-box-containing protein